MAGNVLLKSCTISCKTQLSVMSSKAPQPLVACYISFPFHSEYSDVTEGFDVLPCVKTDVDKNVSNSL